MLRGVRGSVVTLTALALLAGCGGAGDAAGSAAAADPLPSPTGSGTLASATPSTAPSSAAPSARATTAPPVPTRRPVPTRKPQIPLPPPPNQPQVPPPSTSPSASASGATCPTYSGPKAPLSDVKAALTVAAGTPYWSRTSKPEGYTGDGSEVTVPPNLIKAIAWQESGWQSTIIACDGGIGTMQVMPGTASWMNQRFGTAYDVNTLAGNTALGAEYLQWLIMYFGLYYFGSFDLSVTAPVGVGGATMRLRDVVIAGYNVGPGALENDDDTLSIPNRRYVDSVVALMSNCVCLSY